jgi:hypothetical protein
MIIAPTVKPRPADCCSHTNGLGTNCQRRGRYKMVGVRGKRGSYCQQHAEIILGRALTDAEKAPR